MVARRLVAGSLVAPSLFLASSLAFGAAGEGVPQVNGTGAEKVEVLPTTMRMALKIQAKADTLDKALADLQKQFDELKVKLAATNPAEGTLKMKAPELAGGGADMRELMSRRMRQRFSRGEDVKPADKKEEKKEVAVEAAVEAEWKLKSADAAGLLRESEKLRETVQAAIPKKVIEKKEGATEEEEEAALMREAEMERGDMPAGQAMFVFVGVVDKERLAQARKAAFAKARQNAQDTAEAAGARLGAIISLNSGGLNAGGDDSGVDYETLQMMRRNAAMFAGNSDESESVSPSLKSVRFVVIVHASFSLEGAK